MNNTDSHLKKKKTTNDSQLLIYEHNFSNILIIKL